MHENLVYREKATSPKTLFCGMGPEEPKLVNNPNGYDLRGNDRQRSTSVICGTIRSWKFMAQPAVQLTTVFPLPGALNTGFLRDFHSPQEI
jgi:hypothetical protein